MSPKYDISQRVGNSPRFIILVIWRYGYDYENESLVLFYWLLSVNMMVSSDQCHGF